MDVLVDFDNVDERDRRQGLLALCERIASAVGGERLEPAPVLRIRLYGGWFDGSRRSRRAQDLIAEQKRDFPTSLTLRTPAAAILKVRTQLELADALVAEPGTPLHRTVRARPGTHGLRCKWPGAAGCTQTDCSLASVPKFLIDEHCPKAGCTVTAEQLLVRNEQKLTDTMLVADLIYLALLGAKDDTIALVSSDDDMLPGIRTAVNAGARVLQLHTHQNRVTPSDYTRGLAAQAFAQKAL
jgi:uncharacterized LabA/DUF88 family protein